MKYFLLSFVLYLTFGSASQAALDPGFEHHLRFAETVLLARVVAIDSESITFRCAEQWRGKTDAEITFPFADTLHRSVYSHILAVGSEVLLVSQSSDGSKKPRLDLRCPGVDHYSWESPCWMLLPIKKIADISYAEGVLCLVDAPPVIDGPKADGAKLSLPHIKRLLDRFPYDPSHADT